MKATEQYFRVVLFIMLYTVILTFRSVETGYSTQINAIEKNFLVVQSVTTIRSGDLTLIL